MSSSQTLTSFVFSKLLALLVVIGKVVNLLCTFSLALESWHGFKRRGLRSLISGRLYFWVKRRLKGLSVRGRPIFGWLEVGRLGQFQIERHLASGIWRSACPPTAVGGTESLVTDSRLLISAL